MALEILSMLWPLVYLAMHQCVIHRYRPEAGHYTRLGTAHSPSSTI
jgi:hypothetical protein